MTSAINTNNIDVNYPIPGQDNDSQGFRDNFFNIRAGLSTAADEITELQDGVSAVETLAHLVKSGSTLPSGWEGTGHFVLVVDATGNPVTELVGADTVPVKYQIVQKTV